MVPSNFPSLIPAIVFVGFNSVEEESSVFVSAVPLDVSESVSVSVSVSIELS